MPWLQYYSGARAGEITQLRGKDVGIENDIPYVLITPDAGSTKTRKARKVPLHPHLVEQGFLEFVKSRGSGPLFYSERKGQRSRPASVWTREKLAAWVRELGVTDAAVSPTHGWRHLFKQIAGSEDVAITERMSDAITGHGQKTIGRSYGAPTLKDLAKAMAKFPRFEV